MSNEHPAGGQKESSKARWNRRYASPEYTAGVPEPFVCEVVGQQLTAGRALDVAAGGGRHTLWLAARGWNLRSVDVAEAGLARCLEQAQKRGLAGRVRAEVRDLERELLPTGSWDLIVSSHYLQRSLMGPMAGALVAGGSLVMIQPSETNLQRHAKPSRRFLVAQGELVQMARSAGLEIVQYREGWGDRGQHLAELWARRPV